MTTTDLVVAAAVLLWQSPLLSMALNVAYTRDYKGFNNCGAQGWSCTFVPGGMEATYHCNATSDRNARIWIWTARIPRQTTILTVRDCNHVEIHTDCTKGLRFYNLNEFRVINVDKVDVLQPLRPRVYLHDNDQIMHAPSKIFFQNVKDLSFPPKWLENPGGECKYKEITLDSLIMDNVFIQELPRNTLADNQRVRLLDWTKVVIAKWAYQAISMSGDFRIRDSKIHHIPTNGLHVLGGYEILIANTTVQDLYHNAINITTGVFNFTGNNIVTAWPPTFIVLAQNIQITNNTFEDLSQSKKFDQIGHFQEINPGYIHPYKKAAPFAYNFSNNTLTSSRTLEMSQVFFEVCTEVIMKDNIIDCNCENMSWLNSSSKFLDILLDPQNRNKCVRNINNYNNTCPISAAIDLNTRSCNVTQDACLDTRQLEIETEPPLDMDTAIDIDMENTSSLWEYNATGDLDYDEGLNSHLKMSLKEGKLEGSGMKTSVPSSWLIGLVSVIIIFVITGILLLLKRVLRKTEQVGMKYMAGDTDAVMLVGEN